jgi:hypothetical protein
VQPAFRGGIAHTQPSHRLDIRFPLHPVQ